MQNSFSNLPRDEAFALWGYTTNFFYKDLNAWVRTGTNVQKTAEIAALLRQGIQKMPTYTGTAYRALGLQGQDLINFINKYAQEGTEVTFDEFLSAGRPFSSLPER